MVYCSPIGWELSGFSAMTGGIIGFSLAGRLSVLLERWDPSCGLGPNELLRYVRVWTKLHFCVENVARSDMIDRVQLFLDL